MKTNPKHHSPPQKIPVPHNSLPKELIMIWNNKCKRCGECCKFDDGRYCRFMTWIQVKGKRLAKCKYYPDQEGLLLGDDHVCVNIRFAPMIPPTCGYADIFPDKVKRWEAEHPVR